MVEATHEISTSGTDSLSLLTTTMVNKGEYLTWYDATANMFYEHIVSDTQGTHDNNGKAMLRVTGINSVAELYGRPVGATDELRELYLKGTFSKTVADWMELALYDTRWTYGGNGSFGTSLDSVRVTLDLDKESARSLIAKVVEAVGGEMRTSISMEGHLVSSRTIYIYKKPPTVDENAMTQRRFTYGKNTISVSRDVASDEVYTAVIGLGAHHTNEDGDKLDSRITVWSFGSSDVLNRWGVPDGNGIMTHKYAYFDDESIESETELQSLADEYLETVNHPKITYTVGVSDIGACTLGEYVDIVDESYEPALYTRSRVTSIKKNLLVPLNNGEIKIGEEDDTYKKSVVKTNEAAAETKELGEQNQQAEEAHTVSSLDSQINKEDTGLAPRVTALEKAIEGGGGDCPYVKDYDAGIGIFDPTHVSDTEPELYVKPTKSGSVLTGLSIGAMLNGIVSKLRRAWLQITRATSYDSGGAELILRPPTTADSIPDGAYLKLKDYHSSNTNSYGHIELAARWFSASTGEPKYATITLSQHQLRLASGAEDDTRITLDDQGISIGDTHYAGKYITIATHTSSPTSTTGRYGKPGDIKINGTRVYINGNEVYVNGNPM